MGQRFNTELNAYFNPFYIDSNNYNKDIDSRIKKNKKIKKLEDYDERFDLVNKYYIILFFNIIPKDIIMYIISTMFDILTVNIITDALKYGWNIKQNCLYPPYVYNKQDSEINKCVIYDNKQLMINTIIYNKYERRRLQLIGVKC